MNIPRKCPRTREPSGGPTAVAALAGFFIGRPIMATSRNAGIDEQTVAQFFQPLTTRQLVQFVIVLLKMILKRI